MYYYIQDDHHKSSFSEASLHFVFAAFLRREVQSAYVPNALCLYRRIKAAVGKENAAPISARNTLLLFFLFCGVKLSFLFYFLNFAKKRCSPEHRFFAHFSAGSTNRILTTVLIRTIIVGYIF